MAFKSDECMPLLLEVRRTRSTVLLQTPHVSRIWSVVWRVFIAILCVCGHFIPCFVALLPQDATGVRAVATTVPPFILDALWAVSIENVLDHASFVAVASHPESSVRRRIRKADSLNTVVKAVILKLPSVTAATAWVFVEAGFPWWICAAIPMGGLTFWCSSFMITFMPLVKERIEGKSLRDKSSEMLQGNMFELQAAYNRVRLKLACARTIYRLVLCCFLVGVLLTEGRHGHPVSPTTMRLAHELYTVDTSLEKTTLSLPHLLLILEAMTWSGHHENLDVSLAEKGLKSGKTEKGSFSCLLRCLFIACQEVKGPRFNLTT